jgi:hypothetical protein
MPRSWRGREKYLVHEFKGRSEGVIHVTKVAIIVSAVLLFAGIAAASSFTGLGKSDTPTISTPAATTDRAETEPGEDISGPCDEAEHANDPRCTGADPGRADDDDRDEAGEDVRGPCDEAEHANDPRCTGAGDNDRGEDRGHDGRDNSGPGSDNSGPGGGGNSGRGGGDDD